MPDRADQQAVCGVARDDGRPPQASCEHRLAGVESQRTFLLLRTVTGGAVVEQLRPHVAVKQLGLLIGGRIRGSQAARKKATREQAANDPQRIPVCTR